MGNSVKDTKVIQRYEIVEAKTVNDLVRLVNLKTKAGWFVEGGVTYAPTNICLANGEIYPFCQSITKIIISKK